MAGLSVSRITEQEHTAYRVSGEYIAEIYALLAQGYAARKFDYEVRPHALPDGTSGSKIIFRYKDADKVAYPNYWIIVCDDLDITIYDPPTAQGLFTDDTEIAWAAIETAPGFAVTGDGEAEITFMQPASLNGPWTYSVALTDVTAGATTQVTPAPVVNQVRAVSDSLLGGDNGIVLGARVALPVDVTPGHEYTATVTVECDRYERSATSVATQPLAVAPEPDPPAPPEPGGE